MEDPWVVTLIGFPFWGQEPEHEVAKLELLVMEVTGVPQADGTVAISYPPHVQQVVNEGSVVIWKVRVIEGIVSFSASAAPASSPSFLLTT